MRLSERKDLFRPSGSPAGQSRMDIRKRAHIWHIDRGLTHRDACIGADACADEDDGAL